MTVLQDGNFVIGVTSPEDKLDHRNVQDAKLFVVFSIQIFVLDFTCTVYTSPEMSPGQHFYYVSHPVSQLNAQ